MSADDDVRSVEVPGGALAVELLPGDGEPVLAVHGVSSNRRLWNWLREAAPSVPLVAPDLRGRADSVDVAGPSSVARHVADVVAVLDALSLERVHVVGMSMGGFVAVQLAVSHPDRVRGLVLVDGGPPMSPPPGLSADDVGRAFADRLARTERTWGSVEEYAAFFTSTTAPMLDATDPLLLDHLAHDLRDGRVRLSSAAVVQDATDVFGGSTPWTAITAPVRFLHAEFASGPGTPGAYGPDVVARAHELYAAVRFLPGLDHAGSVMTREGAAAVAEELTALRG